MVATYSKKIMHIVLCATLMCIWKKKKFGGEGGRWGFAFECKSPESLLFLFYLVMLTHTSHCHHCFTSKCLSTQVKHTGCKVNPLPNPDSKISRVSGVKCKGTNLDTTSLRLTKSAWVKKKKPANTAWKPVADVFRRTQIPLQSLGRTSDVVWCREFVWPALELLCGKRSWAAVAKENTSYDSDDRLPPNRPFH